MFVFGHGIGKNAVPLATAFAIGANAILTCAHCLLESETGKFELNDIDDATDDYFPKDGEYGFDLNVNDQTINLHSTALKELVVDGYWIQNEVTKTKKGSLDDRGRINVLVYKYS